jgi:photosynthetic reaction center cytochrome c subunit
MTCGDMSKGLRAFFSSLSCICLATAVSAQSLPSKIDPATANRPVLAEEYFKNIQSLRGIPVDEFMDTMGMFAAATNMSCADCHIPESGGSWDRYADDNEYKQKTRMMIAMVDALNKTNFGGRRMVTCVSCHRMNSKPDVVPSLELQYSTPPSIDPVDILRDYPGPSVDQILDRYIQALGGAQRVNGITSIVGKGTYRGYDDFASSPLDLYAKVPNQRSIVQHTDDGDITNTYDGHTAWTAAPSIVRPYSLVTLTGGNLEGANVDALLMFPGRIKQAFSGWRVGPATNIDDRNLRIVQGTTASGFAVKFYFDDATGLLVRTMRYSESPVGRVPVRIDYSDYREVSGVKIPFKWLATWTDGRTVFELNSVQVNSVVDAVKFTKPSPPAPLKTASR